jgi:hypothetical protein
MTDRLTTQLVEEKQAFADAQQILDDFVKFLRNGGLDVVGANSYDRQQCYDKYESLEVMLNARRDELSHRGQQQQQQQPRRGRGGVILEDIELNLRILNEIILNAVYFMVPNNETRRVMNSGKIGLLYSRDPLAVYDARYYNQ